MTNKKQHKCNPAHWVQKYSDNLFRFALLRVNNTAEAEDLVQETFFSALKNMEKFRGDSSEKTWLYNILKNKIIDHYRKNRNRSISSSDILPDNGDNDQQFFDRFFIKEGVFAGHWTDEAKPGKWGENLRDKLESQEFLEILQYCITLLPGLWSSVFRMKHFMDKETKEISKELNVTTSNIWVIIHRTRLQLRGCLEKNWINQ